MVEQYPYAQIAPDTYEINEYDNASVYLLVGQARALLIDTGIGVGDLRAFAEKLAQRPVDVLLTHNHRDHVGNAPLFERVYISRVDQHMGKMIRPLTTLESRLQYAHNTRARFPERQYPWTDADFFAFAEAQEPTVIPIDDGFVFDLGGRKVRCWLCPGHTPGSMVAIDEATGILFCGDACNNTIGLGVRPIVGMRHATVEEALAGLRRVWGMEFDHARIYNGHGDFRALGQPLAPHVYPTAMRAMEHILSGDYHAQQKCIASIQAQVEIVVEDGVELQFHRENIHGASASFDAEETFLLP